MHPRRRSLPFPLNCQLVRVGTADYGGASDQVSETAGRQPPALVFVLVVKTSAVWGRLEDSEVHIDSHTKACPPPALELSAGQAQRTSALPGLGGWTVSPDNPPAPGPCVGCLPYSAGRRLQMDFGPYSVLRIPVPCLIKGYCR